jgi:hypothetical protein
VRCVQADTAVHFALSLVLIALLLGAGLCLLDDHAAGVDLCFLILGVIPVGFASIHSVLAGRILPFVARDPWLLLHRSPPSPI